jgi:UDP-2,4-diacetamido-2,4,6-trideoxy-beta-L-altropyranose hydrolase
MTNALFRVDAGPDIGSGHMMRCLALAEAWCARGGSVALLTSDQSPLPVGWAALGAEIYRSLLGGLGDANDLIQTRKLAAELRADWVVADGYHFAESWLEAVGKSTRLLYLDDLGERDAAADLVLNQNAGAETHYGDAYARCKRSLLGLDWFLLGSSWRETRHSPEPRRLLITLGGSSCVELTLALMRNLLSTGGCFFADVVVTALLTETDAVVRFAECNAARFKVHQGPLHLPSLMTRAVVVVCGGGVTSVEALSLGAVPVIITLAENQIPGSRQLAALDVARVFGANYDDIVAATNMVHFLLDNEGIRRSMAENARRILDGQGAQRVAQVMMGDER